MVFSPRDRMPVVLNNSRNPAVVQRHRVVLQWLVQVFARLEQAVQCSEGGVLHRDGLLHHHEQASWPRTREFLSRDGSDLLDSMTAWIVLLDGSFSFVVSFCIPQTHCVVSVNRVQPLQQKTSSRMSSIWNFNHYGGIQSSTVVDEDLR